MPRNDIESKSPLVPPRGGSTLQRSATLPANPKIAKRTVPFRVRSPSTDQVCDVIIITHVMNVTQ